MKLYIAINKWNFIELIITGMGALGFKEQCEEKLNEQK